MVTISKHNLFIIWLIVEVPKLKSHPNTYTSCDSKLSQTFYDLIKWSRNKRTDLIDNLQAIRRPTALTMADISENLNQKNGRTATTTKRKNKERKTSWSGFQRLNPSNQRYNVVLRNRNHLAVKATSQKKKKKQVRKQ